jgi:hypothetical protein
MSGLLSVFMQNLFLSKLRNLVVIAKQENVLKSRDLNARALLKDPGYTAIKSAWLHAVREKRMLMWD